MAIHAFVLEKQGQIQALCRQHHVACLDLFGSATRDDFDPSRSDLDFLVEFEPVDPKTYADAYWALLEELEHLLGRRVDLVVRRSVRNPYFLESLERTRIPLHAA